MGIAELYTLGAIIEVGQGILGDLCAEIGISRSEWDNLVEIGEALDAEKVGRRRDEY